MPHICGPHSQLPNCRYQDQRRQQHREEPITTWVPIPIHKVQEVTEELANNSNFNRDASLPYQVQQPQRSSPPSRSGGVAYSANPAGVAQLDPECREATASC